MKKLMLLVSFALVLGLVLIGCPQPNDSVSGNGETPAPPFMPMVMVEGTGEGTFTMGSAEDEENAYNDEKPEHPVTLNSFYLGSTEVTEAQWEAVVTDWPGTDPEDSSDSNGANYPARYISWYDAIEFCNALTRKELTEEDVVYTIMKTDETNQETWTVAVDVTKRGYRLPTEAEWEYAAGGAQEKPTTYAGTSDENELGTYAVYDTSDPSEVKGNRSPVSEEYALYDMSGNVWEWCYDRYDNGYYDVSVNPDNNDNPTGPASSLDSKRVIRGGNWPGRSSEVRVAFRYNRDSSKRFSNIGFRVARNAE